MYEGCKTKSCYEKIDAVTCIYFFVTIRILYLLHFLFSILNFHNSAQLVPVHASKSLK